MSKTYAVPDIHGRFDLLQGAIAAIEAREKSGTVVFLGDYIDRGPGSRSVIERLIAGSPNGWNWVCLKGNHEAMMIEGYDGVKLTRWLGNGGVQTLDSYGGEVPLAHVEWANQLPMWHSDKHRVYVHAGLEPELALDQQREAVLLWTRYPPMADIRYPGLHIVHGHTPNPDGPELYSGRTNLDTGAVFDGRLVIGVFEDDEPGGPIETIEIFEAG